MSAGLEQGYRINTQSGEKPRLGPLPRRDLELLTKRALPALRALIKAGYFSLSVEGAEHVPRRGSVIYVGNHAGWLTLDTLLGALAVADHVGVDRLPWGAVQDELLRVPKIGRFFEAMGGFPASWLKHSHALPAEMQVFCVYPEGAEGSCKSFLHAYQMREWRTGFVRLALARGATIVPVAIIGGEECLPVVSTIRFVKPHLGTILPVPFSIMPFPSRWKFIFQKPLSLSEFGLGSNEDAQATKQRLREIAASIRESVQRALDQETSNHSLVRLSKFLKPAGEVYKG